LFLEFVRHYFRKEFFSGASLEVGFE